MSYNSNSGSSGHVAPSASSNPVHYTAGMPNVMGVPVNYPIGVPPAPVPFAGAGYVPPPMMIPVGMPMVPDFSMDGNDEEPEEAAIPPPTVDPDAPLPEIKVPLFQPYTIAVFVGNICENVTDAFLRQILSKCGSVISWKRIQGLNGKMMEFGFCEYSDKESALRAVRLLNQMDVAGRELLVKIDQKPQDMKVKLREPTDFERRKLDDLAKYEINKVLNEHREVLNDIKKNNINNKPTNLEGLGMDEYKKKIVSEEIRSFRKCYEKSDSDDEKSRGRREGGKSKKSSDDSNKNSRNRSRDGRNSSKSSKRRSSRSPSTKHHSSSPPSQDEIEKRKQERRRRERENAFCERVRNWERREKVRQRDYARMEEREIRRREDLIDDSKQMAEFLAMYDDDRDDRLYYQGAALQKRLQDRQREIDADERETRREMEEMEMMRITSATIEETVEKCLAANSSLLLDPKSNCDSAGIGGSRSNGSSPKNNLVENSTESNNVITSPRNDPAYLISSTNQYFLQSPPPDVLPAISKIVSETQEWTSVSPDHSKDNENVAISESADNNLKPTIQTRKIFGKRPSNSNQIVSPPTSSSNQLLQDGGIQQYPIQQNPSTSRPAVFSVDDEEDEIQNLKPKVKLSKIDRTEYANYSLLGDLPNVHELSADEKKAIITKLVEAIPTTRDQLFDVQIKWKLVDKNLIEKKIKLWITKKIIEYIGEEEPTLTEFICAKILSHTEPREILKDITLILDDEAEVFTMKLWRLLVYETEARHLGIVKYDD